MAVNKVNLANGETLVDLTGDSVNAETLAEGTTAHDASGNPIVGKMPTTNVLYTEQALTEAQKAQARENIGAQPAGSYLESTELTSAIDTALAQAKESGEFKGDKGDTGATGAQGPKGDTGATGSKGADGYTPVKGVDYWTAADQEAIVQQVIVALGTPVFGTVDADNNIILTGDLADGRYSLKYESAAGETIEIGTLDIGGGITNMIPLAINADGTPYVGTNGEDGYKVDYRLNSSGAETAASGMTVTGFIPVKAGDVVYMQGIEMARSAKGGKNEYTYIGLYDSTFANKGTRKVNSITDDLSYIYDNFTTDENGYVTSFRIRDTYGNIVGNNGYMRISAVGIDNNSIITINQQIE